MFALLETPADLQPWVQCIWTMTSTADDAALAPIAPDGRCEWIIHLREPPLMAHSDGWRPQPRCYLFGQLRNPLLLHGDAPMLMLGVRLHPHAVAPLLYVSGTVLDPAPLLFTDLSKRLRPLLSCERDSMQATYAAAVSTLRALARDARAFDPLVGQAWRSLDLRHGERVAAIAARLGVSTRTLERRFVENVGLNPKRYARIQRMQRSLRLLATPRAKASDVAHAMGYADQAHMTRELVQLAGCRPSDIRAS